MSARNKICALFACLFAFPCITQAQHSVARQWDEEILGAIRIDFPRPPVHARNLWHLSIGMYDAWAAYDPVAVPYLNHDENPFANVPLKTARNEAISYAAFRILSARYRESPGGATSTASFRAKMIELGYDPDIQTTVGNTPRAVGNRIAARVLAFGFSDRANDQRNFADNTGYAPVNQPLQVKVRGTVMADPNRWQPLALDTFISQNGIPLPISVQTFVGPHWGHVTPFALRRNSPDDPFTWSQIDPGLPPLLGGDEDARFKAANVDVIRKSGQLDPDDGVRIDISPGAMGNSPLGTNNGIGHTMNPVTGLPYAPNVVLRGDYGRILAEFWADGPDSETPPGHWNTLANYVSDHPAFEKRFEGEGPILDNLDWDVKVYFAINGAVHDAAVASWGAKGEYDYVRPISSIRYMGGLGQSSDPDGPSYHPDGLPLVPDLIETITEETVGEGGRHNHLVEIDDDHVGDIAIYSWLGNPDDPENEYSGAGWILAEDWIPYQRDTFVTPPFAGYTSGHSTFSRSAAEVMTAITGSRFFPGGLGVEFAPMGGFLEFESGPTEDIELQFATYQDAADQAGISRLWGGIHVEADDFGGRIMGFTIGRDVFALAKKYYTGAIAAELTPTPTPTKTLTPTVTPTQTPTNTPGPNAADYPFLDIGGNGIVDAEDLLLLMQDWHRSTQ
jgi:hypothetical protein